jgi:hypothetical protein
MTAELSEATSEARSDLGDLVEEYKAQPLKRLLVGGAGFVLTPLGGLALVWAAASSGSEPLGDIWPVFVFGPILLVAGGLLIWLAFFWMGRTRFLLHDGGFVYASAGAKQSFRWQDLVRVQLTEIEHRDRYGNTTSYSHVFRIYAANGQEIVLDDRDIGDGEELGRTIMRELRLAQLKELLKMALSMEAAGEVGPAMAAYEQLFKESPYNQIGEQARERMERLRQTPPPVGGSEDHGITERRP